MYKFILQKCTGYTNVINHLENKNPKLVALENIYFNILQENPEACEQFTISSADLYGWANIISNLRPF